MSVHIVPVVEHPQRVRRLVYLLAHALLEGGVAEPDDVEEPVKQPTVGGRPHRGHPAGAGYREPLLAQTLPAGGGQDELRRSANPGVADLIEDGLYQRAYAG